MSSTVRQTRDARERTMSETVEVDRLLLRPEEVARALGVGRTLVFELIRTGELRSVKIGKSRRMPTEAMREYVAGLSS
jgi:excisionase family DNA binding protein